MCDEQSPMLRERQALPGAIGVKNTAYLAAAWGRQALLLACTVVREPTPFPKLKSASATFPVLPGAIIPVDRSHALLSRLSAAGLMSRARIWSQSSSWSAEGFSFMF